MDAIIIHPKDKEQLTVITYFLNALKIPFDKAKGETKIYNSDFNEKMALPQKIRKPNVKSL